MFDVFGSLKKFFKLSNVETENHIFKLHYKLTFAILLAFCVISTSRQFIGPAIICDTDHANQNFINTFCWTSSTFTIPNKFGDGIPHPGVTSFNPQTDQVKHHKYYQWTSLFLLGQAILFYIPHYLWKIWEGNRLKALTSNLKTISLDGDIFETHCQRLCEYFVKNMHHNNSYYFKFVFCEMLNLINVVGQMFLIDWFLNFEFSTYGLDVFNYTESNQNERIDPISNVFPTIAKCSFSKYGPSGTVQTQDALCILTINVLYQKVYIFLWFWFIFLAVISICNLLYRILTSCSHSFRQLIFRIKYGLISRNDTTFLCSKFDIGDWFMLNQIGKNIDAFAFKNLILDLTADLKNKDCAEFENMKMQIDCETIV